MTWSVDNIDGHLPGYLWESFATYHVAAGILVGTLVLALSYPMFHQIYMKKSDRYRDQLTRDQQIIVIHHSVQALCLGLLYIPFTYVVLSVNFEEQPLTTLGDKFTAMATFMSVIIVMYLIEIASRFGNLRGLVVAHHLCAYMDGIVTAYFLDTANVKSASLLVYFITYEAPTFVGLVMYRLVPDHRWTRPMIIIGMVVFGLSRPIQFIWIVAGLIETWSNVIVWQAIFQIVLTSMFTTLQLYSLTIHYSLYKKIGVRRRLSMPSYYDTDSDDGMSRRRSSILFGAVKGTRRSSFKKSSFKKSSSKEQQVAKSTAMTYQTGAMSVDYGYDSSDEEYHSEPQIYATPKPRPSMEQARSSKSSYRRSQRDRFGNARKAAIFDETVEFSVDDNSGEKLFFDSDNSEAA